jgi:predicted transcriptional regulator
MRRSRFEIIVEILKDLREPTCWTNIKSHCNMSSTQSKQYLNLLQSNDLIQRQEATGKVTYQRTEAGRKLLKRYGKLVRLLDLGISASPMIS